MQREIQVTADGSHTISIPGMNVTYHSKHGAVQESRHVFIEPGLLPLLDKNDTETIAILEMGLGTGLNALLTWQTAKTYHRPVSYTSIELYPLSQEETAGLNYGTLLSMEKEFRELHACSWNQLHQLDDLFELKKIQVSLAELEIDHPVDCIYFDAFAPTAQPELWTKEIFEKLLSFLRPGGTLLTYCSKSVVRHAMKDAGFLVEKLPGPIGKREMVRSRKPMS